MRSYSGPTLQNQGAAEGSAPAGATISRMCVQQPMEMSVLAARAVFDPDNDAVRAAVGQRAFLLVLSPTISTLYGETIAAYLAASFAPEQYRVCVPETGESNKRLDAVQGICDAARAFDLDRGAALVAVGGGVLLDLAALAAALFRRGTEVIKIGTTLVALVDAAVGAKCGANFRGSKNLLGAFYPPRWVLTDVDFLRTLPAREIRCGLAEMLKMALIKDAGLFHQLAGVHRLLLSRRAASPAVEGVVARSIQLMHEELEPNLLEHDLKRLVDFGHTFSPYLEMLPDRDHLHGEAVALDMALSVCIASTLGMLGPGERGAILDLMAAMGLPLYDRALRADAAYDALTHVVSHRGGALNLPLPTRIGRATFLGTLSELPRSLVRSAAEQLHRESRRRLEVSRAAPKFTEAGA